MKLEWGTNRNAKYQWDVHACLASENDSFRYRAYIRVDGAMFIWSDKDQRWCVMEASYPMTVEEKKAYLEVLIRMGEVP